MDEPLIARIESLEHSCRRWKAFALVMVALLIGFILSGGYVLVHYRRTLRDMELVRVQEAVRLEEVLAMREQALAVQQALEAKLKKAKAQSP